MSSESHRFRSWYRGIGVFLLSEEQRNWRTREREGAHIPPVQKKTNNLPQKQRRPSTTKISHTPKSENVYHSVQIISTSVARKRLITVLNKQDPWNTDHRDHPNRGGKAPNRGLKATARSDRKLPDPTPGLYII